MPQNTQSISWRDRLKKHRGKLESAGFLLSAGVGAGIGALLGTFVFPGFGTAAGALVGAGFGATASLHVISLVRTIVRTSNWATGVGVLGVLFSSVAAGALIGGLIGTFVFPGIGSGFGAAIGICIAGGLGTAQFFAVHALPSVKQCRIETQEQIASEEQSLNEQRQEDSVEMNPGLGQDPGANSYGELYQSIPTTHAPLDPDLGPATGLTP